MNPCAMNPHATNPLVMNPRELLRSSAARLREAGIPDPVTDAALLLSSLCGQPPLSLRLDVETELPASLLAEYERLLRRRLNREPLQYILKETVFCGLSFHTDARALIPRPETELLCSWAGEIIASELLPAGTSAADPIPAGASASDRLSAGASAADSVSPGSQILLLDLCCGTGCIGLTLKHRFPALSVTLADISRDALSLAAENAEALGLSVSLAHGDLFHAVPDRVFDLIVSNPPYIPSAACPMLPAEVLREPALALDGGKDGLDFYRRIIALAPAHLSPEGCLLMELGMDEAPAVAELLEAALWRDVTLRRDDRGIDRMIYARRPEGRTHG